jgi:hypothetical protein
MAIIRPTRKNSGVETLIKILALLTDDITLFNGQILMSQFSIGLLQATKMSLFIDPSPFAYIGPRNVWLQDYKDGVSVYYANEIEACEFLGRLELKISLEESFPEKNRQHYRLDDLDTAAEHIRNYLLIGLYPGHKIEPPTNEWLNKFIKAREWDVLATFEPSDIALLKPR